MIAGDISASPGTTKRIVRRTLEFAAYAYLYGEIEQVEEQARALDSLPEACSAACHRAGIYATSAPPAGRCKHHSHPVARECIVYRYKHKNETGQSDDCAARTPHCTTLCDCWVLMGGGDVAGVRAGKAGLGI